MSSGAKGMRAYLVKNEIILQKAAIGGSSLQEPSEGINDSGCNNPAEEDGSILQST